MKKLLIFTLLIISPMVLQAAGFKEGVDYKVIAAQATDSGDKIEVQEFFWYGCPHCFAFEPTIAAWNKSKPANVEFIRVPAIFRPDWEVQARAYYALKNMGLIEDMHGKIFTAIHKDKNRLNKKQLIVDFLEKNGVDKEKFLAEYSSFSVDGMVRKAKRKLKPYQIQGVPTVAVNGKYITSGSMAGSYERMIKIINYLIEKESK
ncbi:MAG TPA: thiol:disulfide interchange protein DsbA/DsbL [Gammaproteobacteria bacterium]|nr:thiol:disulfide interchange protein DsbA/DsbL [Gammaproteobacteria bacterium]